MKAKGGVNIVVKGTGAVSASPGDTVLDSLLNSDYQPEYHCKGGYCGYCIMKIVDGEVVYKEEPIADIEGDEVLTCCAYPSSNTLVIESL